MSILLSARFHTTVAKLQQLPRTGLTEIAFAGRSNSGKSTAINVLCQRRRLAFSSRTPGRTQALNYFAIGPADEPSAYLVDTPGYGYAVAPLSVRSEWDALAGRYLGKRAELRGLVLAIDCRRLLTDLDRRLIGWVGPTMPLVILLTKSDKLGLTQRREAQRNVETELAQLRPESNNMVITFSATGRMGIEQARTAIEALLGSEQSPDETTAPESRSD